jgi:hypothetical protein
LAAYRRYTFARNDLLFTMSDNTRMQTARGRDALHARICFHGRAAGESELIDRWWSQTESNRRPPACKAGALPTELWPRIAAPAKRELVGLGRFELPTSRLSSARSNQLSYRPKLRYRVHTLAARATRRSPGNRCSNDLGIAWARPRRKRNVDGEIPPKDQISLN